MKILFLLLFYTALYAVNCEDFNRETDKIRKDNNKVLFIEYQQETIINYNESGNIVWVLPTGHKTQDPICDSNNNTIIFDNIDGIYYVVDLTNDIKLIVTDYFANPYFIEYQLKNPNKSKLDYMIHYENSFITAPTQSLTAQSSAPKDDLDYELEFIKANQLEGVSGKNKRISEGSSHGTPSKRIRTDNDESPIYKMVQVDTTHLTQSQKAQPLPHNDPMDTLYSKGNMKEQVVSEAPKLISEKGNAVNNPEIHETNETASAIDKVNPKTPQFVLTEIYKKQLPEHVIHIFNTGKFFSRDYGVIFKIPSKDEISMNEISPLDTLNSYLSYLKLNQKLILVSKKWIKEKQKINYNTYLVINKSDLKSYNIEVYGALNHKAYICDLRFAYRNQKLKDYIMLKCKNTSILVSDFYVFAELGNNTDEQLTSSLPTENADGYESIGQLLDKLFMGDEYYSDDKSMKDPITKLPELISKSKTDEVFIFVNNDYYKNSSIAMKNIGGKLGFIFKPTKSYSLRDHRLFEVSYITLEYINSKYIFSIKELEGKWTVVFFYHMGKYPQFIINNLRSRRRFTITIKSLNLIRKNTLPKDVL